MRKNTLLLALLITCFANSVVAMQPTTPEDVWFHAAEHGDVATIDRMIRDRDVNVNVISEGNETALIIAAYDLNVKIVERLLQSQDIDVNAAVEDGETAFQFALEKFITSRGGFTKRKARKIVSLLVHRPEINITLRDNYYVKKQLM